MEKQTNRAISFNQSGKPMHMSGSGIMNGSVQMNGF